MKETIANAAFWFYQSILPVAWIVLAVCLLVLLPLLLFRKTRGRSGIALFFCSYVFGLTTWVLSAALTFTYFGWVGLIIGIFFLGVGIVPMAIWAAFFFDAGVAALGWSIIAMLAITFGTRFVAAMAASSAARQG